MAARKDSRIKTNHREAIRTAMIRKRLEKHILGEEEQGCKVDLTPSQVTAALGLLRKTIPDLTSVDSTVTNKTDEPTRMTDSELEAIAKGNVSPIKGRKATKAG